MTHPKRSLRRIACIGEVMIELIAGKDGQAALGIAGDTFNTAVYLARQFRGTEATVSYVTALGTDPYSDRILAAMHSHGLNTDCVERRADQMPGLYAIETDDAGERSFYYWRSASAARSLFQTPCELTLESLNQFDLVLLTGISMAILPQHIRDQIIAWIDRFRAAGGTVVYDSNYRPRLWESTQVAQRVNTAMWARADIALPSVDDEMAMFGDAGPNEVLQRLTANGVTRGTLKRGAEGPLDLASGDTPSGLPHVDKVVDSTAAGDSFNAGYIAAIIQGQSDLEAAKAGHNLASQVIQYPGAIIPEA
ncbi:MULTISPECIES: sugar kinase [unclassified Ruegeria]|uniref:sugar kinase n=1 Tax=unclassified Ruegeria TaxID=2625375 RepID=UPI0014892DA9|nr:MULTISPECIES: sugar kinase [unclassified Ruegeria]